jgi:hypothetical protein
VQEEDFLRLLDTSRATGVTGFVPGWKWEIEVRAVPPLAQRQERAKDGAPSAEEIEENTRGSYDCGNTVEWRMTEWEV